MCSVRPTFVDPTRNITKHATLDPEDSDEEWVSEDEVDGDGDVSMAPVSEG